MEQRFVGYCLSTVPLCCLQTWMASLASLMVTPHFGLLFTFALLFGSLLSVAGLACPLPFPLRGLGEGSAAGGGIFALSTNFFKSSWWRGLPIEIGCGKWTAETFRFMSYGQICIISCLSSAAELCSYTEEGCIQKPIPACQSILLNNIPMKNESNRFNFGTRSVQSLTAFSARSEITFGQSFRLIFRVLAAYFCNESMPTRISEHLSMAPPCSRSRSSTAIGARMSKPSMDAVGQLVIASLTAPNIFSSSPNESLLGSQATTVESSSSASWILARPCEGRGMLGRSDGGVPRHTKLLYIRKESSVAQW